MSHEYKGCMLVGYGVEAIAVVDSSIKEVFKICTGGNVNVVGPSTVLVFVLGIVELWLLLRFGSESASNISFSSAITCLPELNLFSFMNSGLQCSTKLSRSSSLNPKSPRLFSVHIVSTLSHDTAYDSTYE
jgi:hypothetical protein